MKVENMNYRMKFFKRGLLLTAVALTMRTVGMFFGAYISKTVGAEGVGVYTVIMTVYSFAVTVATSGISLTVTRHVASLIGEGREEKVGSLLRAALLYSIFFGALSSLLLYSLSSFIGSYILFDQRTVSALKILSLSLIPLALSSVLSGYFVGVKRVGFNAAVSVVGQMGKISLTVLLVTRALPFGVGATVAALCLGISLTEILAFLLIFLEFLYDRRKYGKREKVNTPNLSPILKTALPLALSAYVRSVLLSVEHVLIPKRLRDRGETSSEAYTHYGILHGMALPLILYPMTPLSSFSGLLVPEFAEDMSGGRERRMHRVASEALNTTLAFAAVSAVILFSFSSELGSVIYGSSEAGSYIAMLSPVIPIMYLDHVTDQVLKGLGEQVYSMWVNITDSLLSVALVWFLIPRLGISGYALVIIIMEGYNFLLSFFRLRRKTTFELNIPESLALPLLLSSFATSAVKRILSVGAEGSVFMLVLRISLSLAAFFLLYLPLRRLSQLRRARKIKIRKR